MKKYLVIGNPIDHSLSPKLQNWWLKENNIDATYDKIKLEVHEIKNFIKEIKEQKIAGCNVTVPFKKTVIPFLYRLSPEAERLADIRKNRMNSLKESQNKSYTDLSSIKKEVEDSKNTFKKYKWPIIDVTRKSVEETAASIIKIYEIYKNNG